MSNIDREQIKKSNQARSQLNPVTEADIINATAARIIKEDTDWQEKALAALVKNLKAEVEDLKSTDIDADSFRVEYGKQEYIVYRDVDAAEVDAISQVKDMLDDEPDSFNQDWLQTFIKVSDTDIRIIAGEQADAYVDDIDDDRALEEAKMKDDYDGLVEDKSGLEDEDTDLGAEEEGLRKELSGDIDADRKDEIKERLENIKIERKDLEEQVKAIDDKMEKMIEDAREELRDGIIKTWEEGLENNPIDFLVSDQGIYSREDALKQSFISIDVDAAAENSISTDGVGHFLSGYDGNEIELDGDFVAYRNN